MNQYTDKETNMLLDMLLDYIIPKTSSYGESGTFITIRGISNYIPCDLLIKIIHNDLRLQLNTDIPPIFKELYVFLHFIKLNRVPLFISSMPEIAMWRLKIGK